MSDFEDASLILTPNRYRAGKAFCVKPFDGSGDLTVVRNTTATRVNENGLIEAVALNVPRVNYPIGGGCPSWLIEPQATNLLTYSEDFTASGWVLSGSVSLAPNTLISPSGNIDASTLTFSGANAYLLFSLLSFDVVNGESLTMSIFTKTSSQIISFGGASISGTDSYSINQYSNGWYRQKITRVFNQTTTGAVQFILFNLPLGAYTIWGAQVERGSYATSYIPTNGAAVTRNADVFSKTGISSLIGQTEGTIYLEASFLNNDLTPKYITISDNTNSKRIIFASTNISNQVRVQLVDSVSQVEIFHTVSDITDFNRFAFVYAENNFKFFINGVLVGSDNSGTVPSGFNTLLFSNPGNIVPFYGKVKSLILFPTAKSDAELINLTTI